MTESGAVARDAAGLGFIRLQLPYIVFIVRPSDISRLMIIDQFSN